MGKRGVAILLVIIVALAVQALRVHSTCPPSCGTCLNGILDPGEVCDRTATPTGCPASYTCSADCTYCSDAQGHKCNFNGVCEASLGEQYPYCSDCPAPCTPNCQGSTCGPDPVCHTLSCGTCSLPATCVGGQCCTPNPSVCTNATGQITAANVVCGATVVGQNNCGQPCTVTGTQCLMNDDGGLPSCG